MAFIVTESCIKCKHTDCVEVCPVDCFYEGPNFLVIHPEECIDCALCEPECPVDAIFSEDELPEDQIDFIEINAELSEVWPNITEEKDQLPEADEYAEIKDKNLNETLSQIEKQFGKGTVMKMGDREIVDMPSVSTGSLGLDIALGIGGLPKGRVVEIFGPESSGKTTLTLQAIAECQKAGGTAAFIDAEHALDPNYAEKLGVNVDELLLSQPDTGEQALEVTDMLVKSGSVDLIVVDSVAALTPRAEIEGDMGDHHMGLQARLMSQALRKITGNIQRSNAMVIFINQIRMKIGVMFGNPETTTGGNALKFYSSVRLDIRRIGAVKEGEEVVGNETRVKVVKNKVSPPFKQAEFQIMYGEGINTEGEILELGQKLELVEKSGSWYSHNGEKIGQGKVNASKFLKENTKIRDSLVKEIRKAYIPSVNKTAKK